MELARAAEDHDALLIVVGTRGEGLRAAILRLIEPSVSHRVINRQDRPVLVVPPPETESGIGATPGTDAGNGHRGPTSAQGERANG